MSDLSLSPLSAISPLDGRYWSKVAPLASYFSEGALYRYRVRVEVEYFLALVDELPALAPLRDASFAANMRAIYTPSSMAHADGASLKRLKEIEAVTNHDVKATEYFVKEKIAALLTELEFQPLKEFVHFGLTSQDINNTAIPLALLDAFQGEYLVRLDKDVLVPLKSMAEQYMDLPMLARTHGQPATPVRLGQALMVFAYRIVQQRTLLLSVPHSGKFGGATGGLNAHAIAYPQHDWIAFADKFVASLGLQREAWTTQISNYDNLCAFLDGMKRINVVLLDLCKDVWQYISMDYFKLAIKANEVGSSAMPHKVNPIDFENAEGNLGVANALFDHLSNKLPVSRLQRDLTDSTVLRNLGVPIAHTILAFSSIKRGLDKLHVNEDKIRHDLDENFVVVSEALQTILRREGFENPYETLKALTRKSEKVTPENFQEFIQTLEVSETVKEELHRVSPFTFIGVVPKE